MPVGGLVRVTVFLLLASLLAGCVNSSSGTCPELAALFATPQVGGIYLQTDARQAWQTPIAANGETTFEPHVPAGGSLSEAAAAPDAALHVVTMQPSQIALAANMTLRQSWDSGACRDIQTRSLTWELATPEEGDSAQGGQGVHVMTAGFWENGTLFYTNIAEIDNDPAWPKSSWYEWEGADPLPVYVYDDDNAPQAAAWSDPQRVTPAAGTVPGIGYFTTISGFNEALKGLSTTTTRVVRLAPEEAYTQAGNEEHVLYGDAIVFYIKVVDVVDFPCPMLGQPVECRAESP